MVGNFLTCLTTIRFSRKKISFHGLGNYADGERTFALDRPFVRTLELKSFLQQKLAYASPVPRLDKASDLTFKYKPKETAFIEK
jgi:hypothetical protein